MRRHKEIRWMMFAGAGWAGFGAVVYETGLLAEGIGIIAMAGGISLVLTGIDKALEAKRRW